VFFLLFPLPVFAESSYVLPYPSFMPGSTLYVLHGVLEKFEKYWYFGNFSKFIYNLKLSDKYLVEAKTLFEYKQYLLGSKALEKSKTYFVAAYRSLGEAKKEGKNISQKEQLLKEAVGKHIEVLMQVKGIVPQYFKWTPEKDRSEELFLWKQIDEGVEIRKNCT